MLLFYKHYLKVQLNIYNILKSILFKSNKRVRRED